MERCGSARSPSCARTSKATPKPQRTDDRRLLPLAFRQIAAALQSPFRNLARREAQRDTVHAIARPCWLGAIGKDMAEMCIA